MIAVEAQQVAGTLMIHEIVLGILLLSGVNEVRSGPWPPQSYACVKTPTALLVDGSLDEAAWDAAPWTDWFVDIEGDRKPVPRFATRAKMTWDDEYFYVGAEMEEPHLWATLRERDSVIYYDNDFEVFLDPDGDSHLYTEIELNVFNTLWDLLLVKPYRDGGPAIHAWDIPGLKSAVRVDGTINDPSDSDNGWSVEIAIPFAVIAETTRVSCPPAIGDRWRVNFSRVQWRLDKTKDGYTKTIDPSTGKSYPEDNWVWSQQRQIAMHEPEHWGVVEFVSEVAVDVELGEAEVAAWHLRYLSYELAEQRESAGAYPTAIDVSELPPSGPALSSDWRWPPTYWSDGERYVLRMESSLKYVELDELGRLSINKVE